MHFGQHSCGCRRGIFKRTLWRACRVVCAPSWSPFLIFFRSRSAFGPYNWWVGRHLRLCCHHGYFGIASQKRRNLALDAFYSCQGNFTQHPCNDHLPYPNQILGLQSSRNWILSRCNISSNWLASLSIQKVG